MIKLAKLVLQKLSKNRKLSIFILAPLAIFLLGLYLYYIQAWPFGQGYFVNFMKAKEDYVKSVDEEARNHPTTALHKLTITRFKEIEQGHLAIISTTDTEIKFLYLNLTSPTYVSIGTYNIDKNTVEMKKLGSIPDSVRGNDIFETKDHKIYASYVSIDKRTCASVNVAEIQLDYKKLFKVIPIHQSTCTLPPYGLHESGGVFAEDDLGNLYFTAGDFQRGYLVADKSSDFGKVLVKAKDSNTFNIFSEGHRNPQGLFWDNDTKQLFETEHGPQGGDEINIVEKGKNYGWPYVTYGTPYGEDPESELFSNKGTAHYGTHEGYIKPLYAFVPSVGTKAFTKIPKDSFEFPNWRGNYLLGSARALFRLVIEDKRVILCEPITELAGLRDIQISDGGIMVASSWEGLIIVRRTKELRG